MKWRINRNEAWRHQYINEENGIIENGEQRCGGKSKAGGAAKTASMGVNKRQWRKPRKRKRQSARSGEAAAGMAKKTKRRMASKWRRENGSSKAAAASRRNQKMAERSENLKSINVARSVHRSLAQRRLALCWRGQQSKAEPKKLSASASLVAAQSKMKLNGGESMKYHRQTQSVDV